MFHTGWLPQFESAAKKNWAIPRLMSSVLDVDISDLMFSLADQVKFWFDQGPVGSCFANAVTQAVQLGISCAVKAGADFDEIQLSRRAVWYFGRKLDGLLGSRSDGGTVTNALRAIHDFGIPTEADWPYKPDHGWLEAKPPQSVITDSKAITIKGLISLDISDMAGIKKAIKSGLPPAIGIYWFPAWDTEFDKNGIITRCGMGEFGHALVLIGWAKINGIDYWEILNSHGPIYPNPVDFQIPGYAKAPSGNSYSFLVSDEYLKHAYSYGSGEMVSPISVIAPSNAKALNWLNAA